MIIRNQEIQNNTSIRAIGVLVIIYSMLTPVENIFSFFGGRSLNRYLAYLIVPLAILYIIKTKKLKNARIIKILLMIGSYILLSIIFNQNVIESISGFITILTVIFLTILIFAIDINEREYKILKKMNIYVMLFVALNMVLGTSLVVIESGRISFSSGIDQNVLAVSLTIPFLIIVDNLNKKKTRKKIFRIVYLIIILYAIILTGSRGGLLSLAGATSVYLLLSSRKSISKKIKISFITIAISALLFIGFPILIPEVIIDRFSISSVVSSGGTGRVEIWSNAFQIFRDSSIINQLFGNGYYSSVSLFRSYFGRGVGMHNDFVTLIIELGIIGFMIFVYLYSFLIKRSIKYKGFLSVSILTSLILGSIGVDLIFRKFFWNAILIVVLEVNMLAKQQYNTEGNGSLEKII